jgi:beta-mannosidase
VYRDAGASWDFEDVTAHYAGELFGVRPEQVRRTDPERALDLARASVAHIHEQTWAEWRRAGSPCAGALVFHYRDLVPGAGLGVVDALGRPKAPWWAMRRALAPLAVLLTDEGLNGLDAHLVNDTPDPVAGTLTVELFAGELRTESVETAVTVPARGGVRVDVTAMFDGFRDLNHSYLFGPPAQDLVVATLTVGDERRRAAYFVDGPARPVEADLGLTARFEPGADGPTPDDALPRVLISTRRTAQFVALDVPGALASDSWFHLPPGASVSVELTPDGSGRPVRRGHVRALNQAGAVTIA